MWVPVDSAVSLAPGKIRTGNFRVNLNSPYDVVIELKDYESWRAPKCQDYEVLRTRWWLSRNGRVVSTWTDYWGTESKAVPSGFYLGAFDGTAGWYNLEVEMASDATCLQAFHPRLRVLADERDYLRGGSWYNLALLGSLALVALSFGFLFVSSALPVQEAFTQRHCLTIFETLRGDLKLTRRRLSVMGAASTLPTIGYMYALTYLLLFLLYAPFELAKWHHSHGVFSRLVRPGITYDSSTTGLLVNVSRSGQLFLNSVPVDANQLSKSLEAELARRADWSVYIEADADLQYQSVIEAMDLVRSAHGKIVLLTPNIRWEAEKHKP